MKTSEKKSFWALMVTQFFGAFNDNVLKILVTLLIVQWVSSAKRVDSLVSLTGVVFVAPFLIFSMIAGRLSDRIAKPRVITATKFWELLVVAVAIASLLSHSIPAMMIALFMLSMQAAFFSPAKYGVLPELMGEDELSDANGLLNMGTFSAIILGTLAGSQFAGRLPIACAIMATASVLGLIASFPIQSLPPAKPEEKIAWDPVRWTAILVCLGFIGWFGLKAHIPRHTRFWGNIISSMALVLMVIWESGPDLLLNWKIIRQDRALKLGIIAVNYFWFMGALLQLNIFLYAKEMMHVSDKVSGFLLIAVAIGIGLGSFLAGRLSEGKVELGLVPLGALGMSLFAIDLLWAYASPFRALFDFFMLGMAGGFYDVPLSALVQWRSPKAERGRVLATANFLSFVAILLASGILFVLSAALNLNPAQVLFTVGLVSLIGTIVIYTFLPDAVWRFVLYVITNLLYRIRVVGSEWIPMNGGALLVCNHLSLADGFLVGGAIPRFVRFLIWRPYYEAKPFHWLVKTLKCIPIAEDDPPKEILRSLHEARRILQEGGLVCLFAEGQISRTGNLLEFKRGFEVIVKGLDVPIIPVNLDRVWGSIFSFEHGKAIFKKPRRIPYPVTITFGEPMKPPVQAAEVRQAVMDLGAEAFRLRLEEKKPLPLEFLRYAKKHPRQLAVGDSSGMKLSYGMLAATSIVLANHLENQLTPEPNVGLLLPSSVGGALANMAISLLGRVPVNLNYTAGSPALEQAMAKAKIQRVITSRKLLEKTGLPATPSMIYLEDVMPRLPRSKILLERLMLAIYPFQTLSHRWGKNVPTSLDATATIMFSSGSTGVPKGVVLTHANILSNILALSQVFDLGPGDTMIGVLPFFHSFGFTATLWFPLLDDFSAVYHANPLDAKSVGELAETYNATLLLATPTFLLAYIRKCTAEQFKSLRYVIVGAERLRDSVAKAFEEKFQVVPLEGYGCTELSPVATVNVPDISMGEIKQIGHKAGKIGQPIPGVSVRIVDPETFKPVAQGESGLMLVKGPNVMQGYLDDPAKTQEALRDGWYVTGDIARVDNEGFVEIVDRLTRFSKIGGEMVPHILVEEKLHETAARTEQTFVVTAVPDEKRGEQLVVLYAGYNDSIDDLCKKLNATNLPKLWIPAKENFFAIDSIPVLGTGKLDLAQVRQIAQSKIQKSA